MIKRSYHSIQFDIAVGDPQRICYLLFPLPPRDSELKWLESMPEVHGITVVMMSGIEWNEDMTPWPAKGLRKNEWFSGKADVFLESLVDDLIPFVERDVLGTQPVCRYLMGVSLSGLFSIWTAHRCSSFDGVASVSGSLWYDGFIEWMEKNTLDPRVRKIWMSLGDLEKLSRNQRLAKVQDCTETTRDILSRQCPEVVFSLEHGTHFSPMPPRFSSALEMLVKMS